MTNRYVRSTDGSDASNGLTWANAEATLTGAAAADVAGDVIWVSQDHAESTAAAITFNWSGTLAAPTRIVCGNDAAEPPTALATTATVTTTGTSAITVIGSGYTYVYGITFNIASGDTGTANVNLNSGSGLGVYESCNFHLATTGSSSRIALGGVQTVFKNCGFQFSNSSQGFNLSSNCIISGGSILADTAINTLIPTLSSVTNIFLEGCDLSNGAAAMNIVANTSGSVICKLRNCKTHKSEATFLRSRQWRPYP